MTDQREVPGSQHEPQDDAQAQSEVSSPQPPAPAEPVPSSPSQPSPEPRPESEPPPRPAPTAVTPEPLATPQTAPGIEPAPVPAPVPKPGPPPAGPRPAPPSRPRASAASLTPVSASVRFGRVSEDGTVYVCTSDGERAVGSFPNGTPDQALAYFARKYDELAAAAHLLLVRVTTAEPSAHEAGESLRHLRAQVQDAAVVGDLAALDATLRQIEQAVAARRAQVKAERAKARQESAAAREAIVAEAEAIVAAPAERIQWKTSSARMRALLDEWKNAQRSGARLDRDTEHALWRRLSAARNSFDKARRAHFAKLDTEQSQVRHTKEKLVAEAEKLSIGKDWGPTATAFKSLMEQWRHAGRAARGDDDALWERFKAAQDAFFSAKDEVNAALEREYEANLKVKEDLITQAQSVLPVKDLEAAKARLRSIQDRWDAAGKVPRKDVDRVEKAMRRVEQSVRDAEERRWKTSNPEAAARAQSLMSQLETAVAGLRADLDKAQASGDTRRVRQAREALEAREQWLAQAKAGVDEFGG